MVQSNKPRQSRSADHARLTAILLNSIFAHVPSYLCLQLVRQVAQLNVHALVLLTRITIGIHFKHSPSGIVTPSVCDSPACVHASSEILYSLDHKYKDIDPCTNFEQYVCGGWRDRHDMRPDQGSIFAGTLMSESAQTRLRHILESSPASVHSSMIESEADSDNFQKLKAAYDACMDMPTLTKRGSRPLETILGRIDEIYPLRINQEVMTSVDNLTTAILFLMGIEVEALVAFSVSV